MPKVLIVDDEPFQRMLMREILSIQPGLILAEAANGQQALDIVLTQLPDLILLDVMMPDLNGLEVCRRIKTNPATRHTRVMMVTALDKPADWLNGQVAGADDYLTKPYDEQLLRDKVMQALQVDHSER